MVVVACQEFVPVDGQQRQKSYTSFTQVAAAMGLKPHKILATNLMAKARAEKTKAEKTKAALGICT